MNHCKSDIHIHSINKIWTGFVSVANLLSPLPYFQNYVSEFIIFHIYFFWIFLFCSLNLVIHVLKVRPSQRLIGVLVRLIIFKHSLFTSPLGIVYRGLRQTIKILFVVIIMFIMCFMKNYPLHRRKYTHGTLTLMFCENTGLIYYHWNSILYSGNNYKYIVIRISNFVYLWVTVFL